MVADIISFDLDNTLVSVSFDKELYNEVIPRHPNRSESKQTQLGHR